MRVYGEGDITVTVKTKRDVKTMRFCAGARKRVFKVRQYGESFDVELSSAGAMQVSRLTLLAEKYGGNLW